MGKKLADLTPQELNDYCAKIAKAAEESRVVGGPLPAVVANAAASAAAEVAKRWWLP